MIPFQYHVPTKIVFTPGAIRDAGQHITPHGDKPFIVTGRRSSKVNGALDALLQQFPKAVVFDAVDENPTDHVCTAAADACARNNCDVIVGVGGGSPIDVAKAAAVLATNGGAPPDYYGTDKFSKEPLPVIAIPTTAGAGSETTPYSVLIDTAENTKRTIGGAALFPKVAILDPELTLTLPRDVTLHTGLDVLSQAMEGMVSKKATPMSDVLALEICRLVRRWLPVAADQPDHLEARSRMLYAAMLSGCVVAQTGTTLVHGMGYLYTVDAGIPHGLANALLLTPLFRINAQHVPQQVAAIAQALGTHADQNSCGGDHTLRRGLPTQTPTRPGTGLQSDTTSVAAGAPDPAAEPTAKRAPDTISDVENADVVAGAPDPATSPTAKRAPISASFPPRGGIKGGVDPEGVSQAITQALHTFLEELHVSPAARDHGLHESQIPDMAAKTHADPSRFKHQHGTFTLEDVQDLYRQSWAGV